MIDSNGSMFGFSNRQTLSWLARCHNATGNSPMAAIMKDAATWRSGSKPTCFGIVLEGMRKAPLWVLSILEVLSSLDVWWLWGGGFNPLPVGLERWCWRSTFSSRKATLEFPRRERCRRRGSSPKNIRKVSFQVIFLDVFVHVQALLPTSHQAPQLHLCTRQSFCEVWKVQGQPRSSAYENWRSYRRASAFFWDVF